MCVCVYRLKERTYSLWAHLLSEQQNYLNPVYSLSFAESHPVLEPSTQPWNFKYAPYIVTYIKHLKKPSSGVPKHIRVL